VLGRYRPGNLFVQFANNFIDGSSFVRNLVVQRADLIRPWHFMQVCKKASRKKIDPQDLAKKGKRAVAEGARAARGWR